MLSPIISRLTTNMSAIVGWRQMRLLFALMLIAVMICSMMLLSVHATNVLSDSLKETAETFFLHLSNPEEPSVASGQGTGIIFYNRLSPDARWTSLDIAVDGRVGITCSG